MNQRSKRDTYGDNEANARYPCTRYAVGFMTKPLIAARRILPDRAFDRLIGAAFGLRR